MHKEAETINVCSNLSLNWRGVFDMDEFYKLVKSWLDFQGYGDEKTTFKESSYTERIKPNGKQLEVKWVCEKFINDYFSIQLSLVILVVGLNEVEINEEGRKIKVNKGEIEVRISSDLIKNRNGKWKKNSLMKRLYENVLIKDNLNEYRKDAYDKAYALQGEMKRFFNLT